MKLLLILLAFLFLQDPEPLAPMDCPNGMGEVAKYDPAAYDGQDFEVGFEYGAEYIDIGGMNWNDDQEVWMVTWFVQLDNFDVPISAAFMKAGIEGDQLFIYEPPKTPQTPAEPILIQSDGKGISHITWCTPLVPTAITLTSFTAESDDITLAVWFLLAGIISIMVIVLVLAAARGKRNNGK